MNSKAMSNHRLFYCERIRRQTYATQEEAKADVFDYIERFYNRWRRHATLNYVIPVEYENQTMRS